MVPILKNEEGPKGRYVARIPFGPVFLAKQAWQITSLPPLCVLEACFQ